MWSVGCIFAELLLKEPLFQAKNELELISMIFKLLGPPSSAVWPGYLNLPLASTITVPPQMSSLRQKFSHIITSTGIDLLSSLLTYDPEQRLSAEEALKHPYFSCLFFSFLSFILKFTLGQFSESPIPKHPDLFASFPSLAAGEKYVHSFLSPGWFYECNNRRRKPFTSPSAPQRAANYKLLNDLDNIHQ